LLLFYTIIEKINDQKCIRFPCLTAPGSVPNEARSRAFLPYELRRPQGRPFFERFAIDAGAPRM
jgi:hypothetical protein